MRSRISTAHSPQAAWQSVTLPTALCPQQRCSRARTVQCSAQHQAVRPHTGGTDGAARHAGCNGTMGPCVTAHRRRQSSASQVRECTGPAMQQHTYTQRARHTHSPARLPVPVGRHPSSACGRVCVHVRRLVRACPMVPSVVGARACMCCGACGFLCLGVSGVIRVWGGTTSVGGCVCGSDGGGGWCRKMPRGSRACPCQ